MRHDPIDPALFIEHRQQVAARLPPNSIAIVHAADPLTTNGDGACLLYTSDAADE